MYQIAIQETTVRNITLKLHFCFSFFIVVSFLMIPNEFYTPVGYYFGLFAIQPNDHLVELNRLLALLRL